MKKKLIAELFLQFEQACYNYKSIECWSARELQKILGYAERRFFLKVTDKVKDACVNVRENLKHHFVDVNKMVPSAKITQYQITDITSFNQ
jgi:DNA-damage-inducible protein D